MYSFSLGPATIKTQDLNHLREQVEEIRHMADSNGQDLSNALGDFCFKVEATYQRVHELDPNDWSIVHNR